MSEEERLLKFENELNFGIETRDGTFYVPKDVAVKAASELLDELAQPQLTIPKSIADELDKYDFELTSKGLMYRNMGGTLLEFSRVTYDEIPQLIVQTIAGNYRIV
ncbi:MULTISPECIES: hypothetical protein, partial [unclassified Lactococcus]